MLGGRTPLVEISHHLGHAHSVAAPSGFDESTILVVDGGGSPLARLLDGERPAGEWSADACEHLSLYRYAGGSVSLVEKYMLEMPYLKHLRDGGMPAFASLGHMFSSTALQIFDDYLEAGKVMGLAPYGRATIDVEEFVDFIDERLVFFNYVPRRFRHDLKWPDNGNEYANLAASVQRALEFALDRYVQHIRRLGLPPKLSYSGGVALNSVVNHRVLVPMFDDIFILPAACDSGTAIGAAYYGLNQLDVPCRVKKFKQDNLGRLYTPAEVDDAFEALPGLEDISDARPLRQVAAFLADGAIVGWFNGGSEFGPRALGQRSILCDARRSDAKTVLNSRVKHREAFRPFAPVVLAEDVSEWFTMSGPTNLTSFMLEVCEFRQGINLPAVVHVDRTGRLQTVTKEDVPALHELLTCFAEQTDTPILVNTSFNIKGEPIVEGPRDALWCLMFTGIDYVYLDGRVFCRRQGFESALDFVPRVVGQIGQDGKHVICDTPHGRHQYATDSDSFATLKCIDGKTDGHNLARQVFSDDQRSAERRLLKTIGWLMRISAIELFDPRESRR